MIVQAGQGNLLVPIIVASRLDTQSPVLVNLHPSFAGV